MAMKLQNLAMATDQRSAYEHYRKPTRRDEVPNTMNAIVPWAALCEFMKPHYQYSTYQYRGTRRFTGAQPDQQNAEQHFQQGQQGQFWCLEHAGA